VSTMIKLDGIMQAPGGTNEDPSGGFAYGGWVAPFSDAVVGKVMRKQLEPADYLLGRKTFENFESYWPHHTEFWPGINEGTKYVLSKSRHQSDWKNTVFLESLEEIQKIRSSEGCDIQVWGSGQLVQLLLTNDLVDEFWLKIYPLTLGKGKKLFDQGAIPAVFSLAESVVTTTGVFIATYKRAGEVETRTIGI
jgi:dihydrofolate reductase